MLNSNLQVIVPPNFDWISKVNFHNIWEVCKDGKFGLYSLGGQLTKCIYDDHIYFNQNFAIVKRNGRMGCVNTKGVEFIPCLFDHVDKELIMDLFIGVHLNSKVALFDLNGKIVLKFKYNWVKFNTDQFGKISEIIGDGQNIDLSEFF